MIRFILQKKTKRGHCETTTIYTIDHDVTKLERALKSTGYSQGDYEVHELLGVEVITKGLE